MVDRIGMKNFEGSDLRWLSSNPVHDKPKHMCTAMRLAHRRCRARNSTDWSDVMILSYGPSSKLFSSVGNARDCLDSVSLIFPFNRAAEVRKI